MGLRKLCLAAAAAASGLAAPAHAAVVATLDASYDPGFADNTSFVLRNLSAGVESRVSLRSGTRTVALADLAPAGSPGASETYSFNALNGPFITGPGSAGLSDRTAYQFSFTLGGTTFSSDLFSPVSNPSGAYVDFLGACYRNRGGCSFVPADADLPLAFGQVGGLVTVQAADVPEPASAGLLGAGLVALAALRRRRRA